ncbi:transposable element Tcb1 transposase [Trichonephila clavipes]|nr:transposable element Tcb1 transposase [Trichonephila clavipes]
MMGLVAPTLLHYCREDRRIVRMAVMDRTATSRTVAQQFSLFRIIRRRLQQSGMSPRRPLLHLHLTGNHRRLRHQWYDERWTWTTEWNDIVFSDESCFCLKHDDGWIRVWRHRGERVLNCCVMHRLTGPALGIMVWGGIGFHCRTLLKGVFLEV